jgi:aryl-alcohol dehydrogenase-like predicted oxidoreductase
MKLGLGTVQFGVEYGISNTLGKVSSAEVGNILTLAHENGIRILDSASTYGISEAVLGENLAGAGFSVVTKTPLFKGKEIAGGSVESLKKALDESLERLQLGSVYGLLVHHASDLCQPNSSLLIDAMKLLVDKGRVQKIGFSAYTLEEIDRVLEIFVPDLVQIPLNVLDQRLLRNNGLKKIKSLGVEIHARSTFLQGLLLMDPKKIDSYFTPIKNHLERYYCFLRKQGLSQLEGALSFSLNQGLVDTVLVGVCSTRQLEKILKATQSITSGSIDFSGFAVNDERFIDPSLWQLGKRM